ncbi:hypothetical protein D3Y59_08485 [Hymenobacter oligotrophus]|uniref:Uncharacterized protein n=1 Tax=Hymenobacter oligotrophus TaxID=2319843 RepID=A0A3B7RSI8_9BACT|nr:hypothetical protein D3Y59_08485 [Hymenobacter oligotrophus]
MLTIPATPGRAAKLIKNPLLQLFRNTNVNILHAQRRCAVLLGCRQAGTHAHLGPAAALMAALFLGYFVLL